MVSALPGPLSPAQLKVTSGQLWGALGVKPLPLGAPGSPSVAGLSQLPPRAGVWETTIVKKWLLRMVNYQHINFLSTKIGPPKSRDVRWAGLSVDTPALPPLLLPAPPPVPAWPGLRLPWGTSDHPWLRGGNTSPMDQAADSRLPPLPTPPLGLACGVFSTSAPASRSGSLNTKLPEACFCGIGCGFVSAEFTNPRVAPASGLGGPMGEGGRAPSSCAGEPPAPHQGELSSVPWIHPCKDPTLRLKQGHPQISFFQTCPSSHFQLGGPLGFSPWL